MINSDPRSRSKGMPLIKVMAAICCLCALLGFATSIVIHAINVTRELMDARHIMYILYSLSYALLFVLNVIFAISIIFSIAFGLQFLSSLGSTLSMLVLLLTSFHLEGSIVSIFSGFQHLIVGSSIVGLAVLTYILKDSRFLFLKIGCILLIALRVVGVLEIEFEYMFVVSHLLWMSFLGGIAYYAVMGDWENILNSDDPRHALAAAGPEGERLMEVKQMMQTQRGVQMSDEAYELSIKEKLGMEMARGASRETLTRAFVNEGWTPAEAALEVDKIEAGQDAFKKKVLVENLGRELANGKKKPALVKSLVKEGWGDAEAAIQVDQLEADLDKYKRLVRIDRITQELAAGIKQEKIVKNLVKEGWDGMEATNTVAELAADLDAAINSPENRQKLANAHARLILYGFLWAIGGTVATVWGYESASSSPGGGTYFIFWGAIVFGIYDILKGVYGWIKYSS